MNRLFSATLVICLAATHVALGSTIYLDDFSGTTVTQLHGTTPDVGGTAWAAHSGFKADGTFGVNAQKGAFLPFAPAANSKYILEATMNVQFLSGSNS